MELATISDPKEDLSLTKDVHSALLALGRAMAASTSTSGTYLCAGKAMLLGIEISLETLFTRKGAVTETMWKIDAFPHSPNGSEPKTRARAVYGKALNGAEYYRSDKETEDRLARNVEELDWCNTVWTQLLETGVTRRDAVDLFMEIIRIDTKFRCPIQEFPSQWSVLGNTRTLDELKVIDLSASIRGKPDWRRKVQDDNIVSKWRDEAYDQDVTPSMFDFMLAELHWLAGQIDHETGIDYATVPGVFFSDSLISIQDRDALRLGANTLSAVPEKEKDWHPGSDEMVLDLVHPSLYPYVRGRTRRLLQEKGETTENLEKGPNAMEAMSVSILRFLHPPPPRRMIATPVAALSAAGSGVATLKDDIDSDIVECMWGNKSDYQWLPVDAEISPGPVHSVRFLSYINNLHPTSAQEAQLYPTLERIFARFVPIFERTLTETRRRRAGNAGVRTEFLNGPTDIHQNYWNIPEPDEDDLDSDAEDDIDDLVEEYRNNREFLRPVVDPFVSPGPPGQAQVTLGGRILQVIVKLANIHLTPEKPTYTGGSWHVEGTDTERIVATGIYYFESENISDAPLDFRQAIDDPPYEQNEFDHLDYLYGITDSNYSQGPTNQHLGSLITPQGRCICFPNGVQHRLSSFNLVDATKPGHRKILVFFLVDPSQRILSTSDVPPQQLEWFLRELRLQVGTRLSSLPPELFNLVCDHIRALALEDSDSGMSSKWLMSAAEAQDHRLRLMGQRSRFADKVNEDLYERGFSLCEH